MKKCSEHCTPACDFCRLYNFNGDETGAYLGEGYCVFYERPQEPGDYCDDFVCSRYKVKKWEKPEK